MGGGGVGRVAGGAVGRVAGGGVGRVSRVGGEVISEETECRLSIYLQHLLSRD